MADAAAKERQMVLRNVTTTAYRTDITVIIEGIILVCRNMGNG